MSLQSSLAEAEIAFPIINADDLMILGFVCQTTSPAGRRLLRKEDIRGIATDAVIINDAEDLMETGDLVRLEPFAKRKFTPLKLAVVTDSGRRLGTVKDYIIEVGGLIIEQVVVKSPLLSRAPEQLIHRSQIVDIDDKQIVVRDPAEAIPVGATEGSA